MTRETTDMSYGEFKKYSLAHRLHDPIPDIALAVVTLDQQGCTYRMSVYPGQGLESSGSCYLTVQKLRTIIRTAKPLPLRQRLGCLFKGTFPMEIVEAARWDYLIKSSRLINNNQEGRKQAVMFLGHLTFHSMDSFPSVERMEQLIRDFRELSKLN